MDLKRFFTFEKIKGDSVVIRGEEYYHAIKVTRLKEGYKLIICDNTDKDYYCMIERIFKDYFIAKIDEIKENDTAESGITLYIGVCKELDTVVQKAVEMGAERIVPFRSQHSNIGDINTERLNKIIIESAKQCGRPRLTTLESLMSIEEAFNDAKNNGQNMLFYEFERDNKVGDNIKKTADCTGIFIGSEGGFSLKEIEIAKENGCKILTLGKRILRVQTAVVAALALCLQGLDRL